MLDLLLGGKAEFNTEAIRSVAVRLGIDTEFRETNELLDNIEGKQPDIAQALSNFLHARNGWIDYLLELEEGKRNSRLNDAEANTLNECVNAREHTRLLLIKILGDYEKSH